MLYRPMGPNGPQVSAVGIGAMSFAGAYGATSEAESHATLDAARDLGVTHIDTSNIYGLGRSEEVIGSYLKTSGARDAFHIATKAGITKDANGKRSYDNSVEHLEAELDGSLRRLGIDCVDLFYVHRREAARPIEEVTETLAALIRKGKIKAFGFSEIAPTSLARAAAIHPVAAVQSEYSLQTRAPELGLIQMCERLGTTLVAFSPVGRGLLTDTPPDPARVKEAAILNSVPRFNADNLPRNIAATAPLRDIARRCDMPTAALAIAWTLRQSKNIIAIPGTRSPAHLHELAKGTQDLPQAIWDEIETALPIGWCHGDRYNEDMWFGPEKYC